ncbi:NAD(P)H-hydrate dehydratase [Croceivirga thetidis]|uniref:Bifunctional NAD(P)H-hydrate repair enzyme n=1 Tax=Croceivirga thetidis TaxID=2721623 RepID=A0ABX1GTB0_9FLAO|nr:NAD(P)H-hydrate dehydratase [Croceivirga thetidis]NKI31962.1 NAD(P)H-hydrate dehydratase [Croceivirga thetidis]
MKVFSGQQIYQADKITAENQNITSDILMERAAEQIFNWLHHRLQGAKVGIHLFCGIGNNGGDGIALARMLLENDYQIFVYIVNYSEKRSKDFLLNLGRLKDRKVWPTYLDEKSELPNIHPQDIIIDGIFGIGLNRNPDNWVVNLIKHLNSIPAFTLSIDIPSGLFLEKVPDNPDGVIRAEHVLTFQFPKLVFFLPETGIFLQNWEVLDIGLDQNFVKGEAAPYEFIGKFEVLPMYRPRLKFSHKGNFGHVLSVGGSYGKIGALILASKASLESGAGLVTAYAPECGYIPIQVALPEAMVLTNGTNEIEKIVHSLQIASVTVGMGMGTKEATANGFKEFLKANKVPIVLDADALNILAEQPSLLNLLPALSVLTPHPGELKRLLGKWKDDFEKLEKAKEFASKYDLILVLKGAHTITIYNNLGYINSTGNPGMATAGSGDVLAGIISGLIAQGYSNLQASIFGVFLHGLAGDIAVMNHGYEALSATKLIDNIGKAFKELFRRPEEQKGD